MTIPNGALAIDAAGTAFVPAGDRVLAIGANRAVLWVTALHDAVLLDPAELAAIARSSMNEKRSPRAARTVHTETDSEIEGAD